MTALVTGCILYTSRRLNNFPDFENSLSPSCVTRCADFVLQATLYVYEMKGSEMAVTKIEHPDRSSET